MQSTYLEVELDEGSEGRPELLLYVALAHEMQRRPLRRREGLEEAELLRSECTQRQLEGQSDAIKRTGGGRAPAIALTGGSGTDRRNQIHSGLMTCLQPGDETDGLDSDTVIDVLDHR